MGKVFLCLLAAIGCSILTAFTHTPVTLIIGFVFYGLAFVFFIVWIIKSIKQLIGQGRQIRRAVDDERIQKLYDKFNKG